MKAKTIFFCTECGNEFPKWQGRCPICGNWNTIVEQPSERVRVSARPAVGGLHSRPQAKRLSEIEDSEELRFQTGMGELDHVLGGGAVQGSLVLIGGAPGIGKSTLLTEVAGHLSEEHKVLYVSAEESCAQIKMRCDRLGVKSDTLLVVNENCLENILEELNGVEFLIVDSIQAVYLEGLSSSAGSVGQVRECASRLMRAAKGMGVTVFIVGHVTKEGAIAGPKVLEHIMDTVLYFEGETQENYRLLRAVKNRFGSANEVGVFEMREEGLFGVRDYAGVFLSEGRGKSAGSIVTPFQSGNRCVLVEIQSLIAKTVFGMPRRMSLGIDYNKMILMIAVAEKRAGMSFFNQDVYLNAMSGIKLNEPSVDLAIFLSLASGASGIPVDGLTAAFGEVGLTGEVRGVSFAEARVSECVKLGFSRVLLPRSNCKAVEKFKDKIELVPVRYVREAVKCLFSPENAREND